MAACASTGNLANSVAAHAARAGMRHVVFIPADLEAGKVITTAVYGPTLIAVQLARGRPADALVACRGLEKRLPTLENKCLLAEHLLDNGIPSEAVQLLDQAVKARREEDMRALRRAMETLCVASVAREPTHELDAVHVAFLVAVDQEPEVEQVIEDLAHEWEGRIDVQLLGPMAAYDFAGTAQSES